MEESSIQEPELEIEAPLLFTAIEQQNLELSAELLISELSVQEQD
jgi:hypothetical protein